MSNEQLIDTLYSIVEDPNNLLDGDATDAINEAIGRIGADSDEIARLRERVRDLEQRHLDASFLIADWDGYYNPKTKTGNVEELASLIEDAYRILQNKSWRDIEPDSVEEKPMANTMTPKYPHINIRLVGEDGNAFSIIARTRRALLHGGVDHKEVDAFVKEAMSGDYNHLLCTVMDWVQTDGEE
jgi:hypothetical protein